MKRKMHQRVGQAIAKGNDPTSREERRKVTKGDIELVFRMGKKLEAISRDLEGLKKIDQMHADENLEKATHSIGFLIDEVEEVGSEIEMLWDRGFGG